MLDFDVHAIALAKALSYSSRSFLSDPEGHKTIYTACKSLTLMIVRMTEFRKLCPGENGSYILHCAIKLDSIIMVRWLLARGADIDHKIDGNTALHEAILCNYREIVDILLDHGADPNVEDSLSRTPLYLAVYNEDVEVVSILLDRDANIEISDNTGKTPLHRAAIAGSEKIAQLLLNAGANPSAVENDGGTPLHIAVDYKNARMVSILLDNGANVDAKKKNGETPLHEAAISGSEKIARLLLTAKADFSAVDVDGETPLHFAISVRDSVVASILLEYGSDVNVKTGSFDRTPLHLAAHMSRWDIAQVLLEYGASLSAVDYYHETPLHTAVRCAPLDFLRQLLNYIKQKCDLNVLNAQPGRDGFTALRMAIDRGSADHVEMLLRNGARFTLCSASGESDLDAALESSNERIKKSGQDFTEWMAMEGRPSLPGLPGHTPSSWS